MKHSLRNLLAGLASAATLLLAACGGGGGGDGDSGGGGGGGPAVTAPTAVATADQTNVAIGSTVTLDGSTSTTPNGGSLSYEWTLAARPDGSAAALSSATTAKPSFVADRPGNYVAALVVKDARASSTAARVSIAATNPDPLAQVTPQSQGVLLGSTVTLDGSTSLAPTGADAAGLSFQWRLIEQPAGAAAVLRSATNAKANFTADKVGIYRATLVVGHGTKRSAAAEAVVTVSTTNSTPVIALTVPATAQRGQTVVLDAGASRDPDGHALHYRWHFARELANALPAGSNATISNANSARASFVPDSGGTYHVDLTVYDGSVAATQRTVITVAKPAGAANTAPVARIGDVTFDAVADLEFELGAWATPSADRSYDLDGDTLTYQWTWWNTATPTLQQTDSNAYLNLGRSLAAGTYQLELVVNDGTVSSPKVSRKVVIKTGANAAPMARVSVGDDPTGPVSDVLPKVMHRETIRFTSGSTDANGDQLEHLWTLVDRPDGSNAVLQNAGLASRTPSVVADQPGIYTVRLQVRDSRGLLSYTASPNAYASVLAKAENNPPVIAKLSLYGDLPIEPAADQPRLLAANFNFLSATLQAFDPDQDAPLHYLLSATRQPSGSAALAGASDRIFSGTTIPINLGAINAAGSYEVEAIVSDSLSRSEPQRASVTFVERANFPSLLIQETNLEVPQDESLIQRFFPFNRYNPISFTGTGFDANTPIWYRLTAFDRDYTVTGLQTSAAINGYAPSFNGLVNGQVIRRGESVLFSLERPRIADEAALVARYQALASESFNSPEAQAAFDNEAARQAALLASYGFTWSFRVAEREGYTFYIGPK